MRELLSFFGTGPRNFGNQFDGIDTGYIFTLNQDWLIERLSALDHPLFDAPTLPGIPAHADAFFNTQKEFDINDVRHIPGATTNGFPPRLVGNLNYIKLHGSFEWWTRDRGSALVVGREKSTQIGAFDLLAFYFDVFEHVLNTGDLRLLVIGYGFADDHINAAIADAVRTSGDVLATRDDGTTIFEAIAGLRTSHLT